MCCVCIFWTVSLHKSKLRMFICILLPQSGLVVSVRLGLFTAINPYNYNLYCCFRSSTLQFHLSFGLIGLVYLGLTATYGIGTIVAGPVTDKLVRFFTGIAINLHACTTPMRSIAGKFHWKKLSRIDGK